MHEERPALLALPAAVAWQLGPLDWEDTCFLTARLWVYLFGIEILLKLLEIFTEDKNAYWMRCCQLLRTKTVSIVMTIASVLLLIYFGKTLIDKNILPLTLAYCIRRITSMEGKKHNDNKKQETSSKCPIGYGAGMACSYFEGYLTLVLPNDGAKFYGLEETINVYESRHTVVFPVKKLFLVITKSLYCPPDLKLFNKTDKSLPYLEACMSLEEQIRDVGGVKNRVYKMSAYMIHRTGKKPIYLVAECATPLLTLHKVKQRRAVYEELIDADFDLIVNDFCNMLENILDTSRECHQKCVLVHYDDTDKDVNVAELLLQKIEELEPKFEEFIT